MVRRDFGKCDWGCGVRCVQRFQFGCLCFLLFGCDYHYDVYPFLPFPIFFFPTVSTAFQLLPSATSLLLPSATFLPLLSATFLLLLSTTSPSLLPPFSKALPSSLHSPVPFPTSTWQFLPP